MARNLELVSALKDILSVKRPVSFREFCTSEEYLGLSGIYEYWLDSLNDPLTNKHISRVVFRGSTGAGKSTIMNLVLLYKIYLLFSIDPDVTKSLKLMRTSPVSCLSFSLSLSQAMISGFTQLRSFIDESPWFKNNFPRDTSIDSEIRFPNNFAIRFASGFGHQISLNIWGFILDEANFREGVGEGTAKEFSEVYALAEQLETRLSQRFLRKGEENFFAGYISSASYKTAFIQDRGDELMNSDTAIVLDPVLYKVDPDRYTENRFEVFFGYGELLPCIVKDEEHKQKLLKSLPATGTDRFFELVPLELKDHFKKNIYLAIQNICGRPTDLKGSFITNYEPVKNSYTVESESPLLQESVVVSNKDDHEIKNVIDVTKIEHPQRPHSLFLDLSLKEDSGSLTCVRYDGIKNGMKMHEHVFTLIITPPDAPAQTDISKVQNFVIWFASKVNLAAFGSDNFQCLVGGTLVSTPKGVKKIKDVKIGDTLLTVGGTCKVVNTFSFKVAMVYKVVTDHGSVIFCTGPHRMAVKCDGGYEFVRTLDLLGRTLVHKDPNRDEKVISVESHSLQTVYDIEVDSPDHSYYLSKFLNHNSAQLRQEVSKALDLPDIRISLDSSDKPFLLWYSACVSGRFGMRYNEVLDREIKEAQHDLKRRRVYKRDKSSDDQFQTLVGAFFLSETIASYVGTLPENINVVGGNAVDKLVRMAGFTSVDDTLDRRSFERKAKQIQRMSDRAIDKFNKFLEKL